MAKRFPSAHQKDTTLLISVVISLKDGIRFLHSQLKFRRFPYSFVMVHLNRLKANYANYFFWDQSWGISFPIWLPMNKQRFSGWTHNSRILGSMKVFQHCYWIVAWSLELLNCLNIWRKWWRMPILVGNRSSWKERINCSLWVWIGIRTRMVKINLKDTQSRETEEMELNKGKTERLHTLLRVMVGAHFNGRSLSVNCSLTMRGSRLSMV